MARDRQRAKQRKQRQAPQPPSRTDEGNGHAQTGDGVDPEGIAPEHVSPDADHIHRANVPGAWEHGGEVDRFEAELVAGAGGEPEPESEPGDEELERDALEADAQEALGREEAPASATPAVRSGTAPTEDARGRGGRRFANFLRASWAELQRVQWPDRRQVGQATAVVLGFVIVAGAFLGVADFVAEKLVDLIVI